VGGEAGFLSSAARKKRELNPNEQVRSLGTPFAPVERTISCGLGEMRTSKARTKSREQE